MAGFLRSAFDRLIGGAKGDSFSRIDLDYPITPRQRPLELSAGGKKLSSLFRQSETSSLKLLREIETLAEHLRTIPHVATPGNSEPHWNPQWMPPLDAMAIYGLIRTHKPKTYLEVGSGTSTKFARRAIKDGGLSTRIISIDPAPRAEIDRVCDEVVRLRFEDTDIAQVARQLGARDIVFVDNSHRSFQSSDVTVFFTEFLPALAPGVIWGLHDIFLPFDYPVDWRTRFYNEQYLLAAYLLGGHGSDDILFAAANSSQIPALALQLAKLFAIPEFAGLPQGGGSFWMQRKSGTVL